MSSSDDYYTVLLNSVATGLYRYVVPVLYIVGNVGNVFSIFIFWKKNWRKKVCVFYLTIHLLFSLCYINTYLLGSIFAFGYNDKTIATSPVLCKLFYYAGFLFGGLLSTILILASIDRLLISSQNVNMRLYSSRRLAYLLLSMGTSVWTVFYIHVLIRYNVYEVYPSVNLCFYGTSQRYMAFVYYSSLVTSCLLSATMLFLLMLSFKNVRRLRAVPQQQRTNQIRMMTKKDFQLLRCLFIQDIVHIFCTIFLTSFLAYTAATKDQAQPPIEQAIKQLVSNSLSCLKFVPSCVNFLIFISVSKVFRSEAKLIFYKIVGKNSIFIRQEIAESDRGKTDNMQLNVIINVV